MTKQVDATCPSCGAEKLNLSLVARGRLVSLAGVNPKFEVTTVPQLWCNKILDVTADGWAGICDWEQDGTIDQDGYASFGKLVVADAQVV